MDTESHKCSKLMEFFSTKTSQFSQFLNFILKSLGTIISYFSIRVFFLEPNIYIYIYIYKIQAFFLDNIFLHPPNVQRR